MATTTQRGLAVPCPACSQDECLTVRLHDAAITCASCEAEWTAEELERLARSWLRLAGWVRGMPGGTGEDS